MLCFSKARCPAGHKHTDIFIMTNLPSSFLKACVIEGFSFAAILMFSPLLSFPEFGQRARIDNIFLRGISKKYLKDISYRGRSSTSISEMVNIVFKRRYLNIRTKLLAKRPLSGQYLSKILLYLKLKSINSLILRKRLSLGTIRSLSL